ncbi:hypothetical protein CWR45_14865 [Oceanobacillus chungangensis]|uniref:GyrI-like small molecule binding domain-containing protein n=1 Tax=Oceanobacillus chungangensis TaxID=1229152 RepID=A0A3D8PKZ7_9BACI|nr:hypothetical protein CWR45_14865 [Oceanobacillus chungangensis]
MLLLLSPLRAFEIVRKNKSNLLLDEVTFDNIEDGLSLQMLHLGSYDEESQTFEIMNAFLEENQLKRTSLTHREIYLSEFRKVEKAKLKTVLRYPVKKSD